MFVTIFVLPKSTRFKKHKKKRNANLGLFLRFLVHLEPIWVIKMIQNIFFCYNSYISMFPYAINTLKQIFFWFLRCLIIFSQFVRASITIADTQSYTSEESLVSALLCLRNCSFMTNGWPHEQLYKQQFQNKWQS